MKTKRMICIACAAILAVSIFTACASSKNNSSSDNSSNTVNKTVLNAKTAKIIGRAYLDNDTLWTAMSGAGAEFEFTGKKLNVTIEGDKVSQAGNKDNYARVGIYVDGKRVTDSMLDEKEKTYTPVDSKTTVTCTVQIIKLSECAMSTFGIKPLELESGASIKPTAAKKHKIEYIGDSITCGYGVDDEDKDHNFSTSTEDVTKSYSYKTAQTLDADYSMFSISGYGIISGYTDDGTKHGEQTIPQYYESLGFSYGSFAGNKEPQSLKWDFKNFEPELIVINLGTNDCSYCTDADRKEEFTKAYVEFLKKVRKNNPNAKLFCTLGIMDSRVFTNIEDAYLRYIKETSDKNIAIFKSDAQNGDEDGYAANWHPTDKTHTKAAEKMSAEIKKIMNW